MSLRPLVIVNIARKVAVEKWNDPKRFTTQPFPGVTLAALKYLHLDRHVPMHGHEPLDTDNTAPEFLREKWLLQHNFAQAERVFEGGAGGFARYIAVLRETP